MLSKTLPSLHFLKLQCFPQGKTMGIKFKLYVVSTFGLLAIENKTSKTNNFCSDYMRNITGTYLINHKSRVQEATELRLVSFTPLSR